MENEIPQEYQRIIQQNLDNYAELLKQEKDKNAMLQSQLILAQKEIIELKEKINSSVTEMRIIGKRPLNIK